MVKQEVQDLIAKANSLKDKIMDLSQNLQTEDDMRRTLQAMFDTIQDLTKRIIILESKT